jgi:hypothetical protein
MHPASVRKLELVFALVLVAIVAAGVGGVAGVALERRHNPAAGLARFPDWDETTPYPDFGFQLACRSWTSDPEVSSRVVSPPIGYVLLTRCEAQNL